MAGQGAVIVKNQVGFRIELERAKPFGRNRFGFVNLGKRFFGGVGVVGLWLEPGETENGRPVGGMADTGKGKRAMQRAAHPGHVEGRVAEFVEKAGGGDHRPHRVRGRGADADLEHVED